jgi:hypothetical protein
MEHRRMGKAGADSRGEHRHQGCRQVGFTGEAELSQKTFQQGQGGLGLRAGRLHGDGELARVEHAKHSGGRVITRRRHQAAVRPQIGLPRQAAQHRQVVVAGRVEQHRRMTRRRIDAHPVIGARVEPFPGGGAGSRTHQGRWAEVLDAGLPRTRVGDYGHDQPAALVMAPHVGQLALGRVHHAMDFTGHDADRRLHARVADLDVHEA